MEISLYLSKFLTLAHLLHICCWHAISFPKTDKCWPIDLVSKPYRGGVQVKIATSARRVDLFCDVVDGVSITESDTGVWDLYRLWSR